MPPGCRVGTSSEQRGSNIQYSIFIPRLVPYVLVYPHQYVRPHFMMSIRNSSSHADLTCQGRPAQLKLTSVITISEPPIVHCHQPMDTPVILTPKHLDRDTASIPASVPYEHRPYFRLSQRGRGRKVSNYPHD
jgi:hypothetical protein